MADLNVDLHLRVTPNVFRWSVASLLLFAFAPELGSESVTLTTYYPAPSGVYTQMITTDRTYLARDTSYVEVGTTANLAATTKMVVMGGNVGIGTTNPNPLTMLHTSFNDNTANPTYPLTLENSNAGTNARTGFAGIRGGSTVFEVGEKSGEVLIKGYLSEPMNFYTLDSVRMTITGGGQVGVGTTAPTAGNIMTVAGNANITSGNLTVGNGSNFNGVITSQQPGGDCYFQAYGSGIQNCSGAYYATLTQGVYVRNTALGGGRGHVYAQQIGASGPQPSTVIVDEGTMLCCRCPGGTCAALP